MKKVIFHLDLDSYFVSAQRSVDPFLIKKPVVISSGKKRSIISAASYEAKKLGVYVPMPFYQAQKLVPDLIAINPNFALYTSLSKKLFDFLAQNYTSLIEVASIDECYLDVSAIWKNYNSPYKLALKIQQDVKKYLKLPISIGISDNKFVAKMSTQINKPEGITITPPQEFLKQFGNWKLDSYHGIGEATMLKLANINIFTIADLAKANEEQVKMIVGKVAATLIAQANGRGSQILDVSHNELKTIGNSLTFQDYDRTERADILNTLYELCELVATRAINRNIVGHVVAIAFKTKGGKEIKKQSKQVTLNVPIQKTITLFQVATELFDSFWDGTPIKFLGVSLNKLINMYDTTYQANIFTKSNKLTLNEKIVREINQHFMKNVVQTGQEFKHKAKEEKNQSRYLESDRILKHFDYDYRKKK